MPVVKNDTLVAQTVINRLTKTQFNGSGGLESNEIYAVDPQFNGSKLLATDSNGEIVETSLSVPTATSYVTIRRFT